MNMIKGTNVLEGEVARWAPEAKRVRDIKQFTIKGKVVHLEQETFRNGNRMLKFVLCDGNDPTDQIVIKAWGDQATRYANLIKKDRVYTLEALNVKQTLKEVRAA